MSTVEAAAGKAQAMVRDSVKTVIAASMVGTAIEFYDFYAYGTAAANYFPKVFFGDTTNPTVALLASLLTFAIAFIARPLGSLVFGHFGDRMGRKTTLVVSLLTMGIATFLIGCLPTYSQWGIVAVAALCLCRFVQGIGLGGEWSGAALVATDAKTDLAVIRVQAQGLIPATLGTPADLVVGQPVVAIGNPLGRLGGTVTDGIISAKDRVISIDGEHMTLLQTNAAVNPGNSGGGLFDAQARLVGVVNSKSSGSDVEGLGFAIPIDTARPVIEQLITQGYVSGRPSLGMELVELTSYRSAIFAGTGRLGVYVNNGGKTGLTNGDYLLSIDGLAIETMTDVKTALSGHSPGDTVTVQYLHGGAVREAAVVLVEDIPAA